MGLKLGTLFVLCAMLASLIGCQSGETQNNASSDSLTKAMKANGVTSHAREPIPNPRAVQSAVGSRAQSK